MQFQEEISEEEATEVEEEAQVIAKPRRQMAVGVVLSVFSAIVLIMIGGLASYYYYTIQSQGGAAEQTLRNTWQKSVDNAEEVTDQFARITKYEDLSGDLGSGLIEKVSTASRDARDGSITIADLAGLNIRTTETADKLRQFLLTDAELMGELRKLLERHEQIEAVSEFDKLDELGDTLSQNYDALLLSSRGLIQGNLPRAVFSLPDDFERLYGQKEDSDSKEDAEIKEIRQQAETVVTKFAEAWKNRDGDAMKAYLTAGAKGEFNAGILESSSDIVSLRILSTVVSEDKTKVSIVGQLEKQTPDQTKQTEQWKFSLLKQGDKWLIDSWKQ